MSSLPNWESIPVSVCLLHNLINEIEIEVNKTGIIPVNLLKDIIFQIGNTIILTWKDKWTLRTSDENINTFTSIETFLRPIRDELCKTIRYWFQKKEIDTLISLELSLKSAHRIYELVTTTK